MSAEETILPLIIDFAKIVSTLHQGAQNKRFDLKFKERYLDLDHLTLMSTPIEEDETRRSATEIEKRHKKICFFMLSESLDEITESGSRSEYLRAIGSMQEEAIKVISGKRMDYGQRIASYYDQLLSFNDLMSRIGLNQDEITNGRKSFMHEINIYEEDFFFIASLPVLILTEYDRDINGITDAASFIEYR